MDNNTSNYIDKLKKTSFESLFNKVFLICYCIYQCICFRVLQGFWIGWYYTLLVYYRIMTTLDSCCGVTSQAHENEL